MSYIVGCFQQLEEKGSPGEQATQGAVETGVHEESQPGRGQRLSYGENKYPHCDTENLDIIHEFIKHILIFRLTS